MARAAEQPSNSVADHVQHGFLVIAPVGLEVDLRKVLHPAPVVQGRERA